MAEKFIITRLESNGDLTEIHPKTTASQVVEEADKLFMTSTQSTKLAGIEENAEVNVIDTIKVNGAEQTVTDGVVNLEIIAGSYIPTSEKGAASGVATLDENGTVPSSQLPSFVDGVVEADSFSDLPSTGESSKIYVTLDTNLTYRWSGSAYVEISSSIALGETTGTAYEGSKGAALASTVSDLETDVETNTTKNTTQDGRLDAIEEDISEFLDGTTSVSNASTADALAEEIDIALTGDATGTVTTDLSDDVSIAVTLKSVGTSGTYSVVQTDGQGRVTSGGSLVEWGSSASDEPSSSLVTGGLFFQAVE